MFGENRKFAVLQRVGTGLALSLLLGILASGCVTQSTLAHAKGEPHAHIDDQGENMETTSPRPGYYALVPLAAVADVCLSPFYLFATLGFLGSDEVHPW